MTTNGLGELAERHTESWMLMLHVVVYCFVVSVIAVTSYIEGQAGLLKSMTLENGFFEWASVIVLLTLFAYSAWLIIQGDIIKHYGKFYGLLIYLVSIAAFAVAGEELSWGQHVLGFEPVDFFKDNNYQRETNIHNLMAGNYLSGFLNTSVYVFFIYGPALIWLYPYLLAWWKQLGALVQPLIPSLHLSIIFSFSSGLHPYFIETSTYDTYFHFGGMLMMLCVITWRRAYRRPLYFLHLSMVLAATLFFMKNTHVFNFYNMQAEIREFLVMYAGLLWFIEWTRRVKDNQQAGHWIRF